MADSPDMGAPPTGARSPRPARRNADRHRAILAAAARLVAERGYNRVSIEAIAARAGAGKQTIYRWWPSKAALFMELYATLAPTAAPTVDTGSVAADLDRFLTEAARRHADAAARTVLAGLLAEAQADPELAAAFRTRFVQGPRRWLAEALARGVARGELRPDADLDAAVDAVLGALWHRLLLAPAPAAAGSVRPVVDQLLYGLAAP